MENPIEEFLNALGDAERAGGRVLHDLNGQARSLELKELLKKVAHDEGYYAGELSHHVRRLGGSASNKTGDFVDKVRAVDNFRGKLELLNRGQRWVIRKINENLANVSDPELKAFLVVMAQGHELNIGALEQALRDGAS